MKNKKGRVLCIGDIHGALKALEQVLDRCNLDYENDQLIFLGDYVDGWSESSEVIQLLLSLKTLCKKEPIFLRGNHDKWCEDWLLFGKIHPYWLPQGGQSTVNSYIKTQYLTFENHREFFKNLKNYYIDEENRGFVHGGYTSRKGLGYEDYEADYYWDRDLWELMLMLHNQKIDSNSRNKKHKELYIGHTATECYTIKPHFPEYNDKNQAKNGKITVPMNRLNVWNLDTGCGFSGKLTIMDVNTKEYFQSDFVKELYPNEKGR